MVVVRLARVGRKNKATFRIVAQEKIRSPHSRSLEIIGSYDPHAPTRAEQIHLKNERVQYWLEHGAQPSATVHNMLVELGIIQAPKRRVVRGKPNTSAQEPQQPSVQSAALAGEKTEVSPSVATPEAKEAETPRGLSARPQRFA